MRTKYFLSVVVACYMDGGNVAEMYRRLILVLPQLTSDYEIIFVNDASPDNAEEVLMGIAKDDPRVVVINHTRNFGSQNAFLSGMRVSRGDGVVLMDGDLQDPPEVIPELVDKWQEGFHIVYGVRVRRVETVFRQVAYKLFYRIFSRLADIKIPHDVGDFGLMSRRVVEVLLEDFPERMAFLRGLRAYTGFKSAGVDYVRMARFDGRSTNSLMSNIRWAKFAVFSFSKKPMEYISVLAFVLFFISLMGTLFYLVSYLCGGNAPQGFMTMVLIILFMGSVQLIAFATLAEYIGHMYSELKFRPRYIVRDVVDNRPAFAEQDGCREARRNPS